MNISDEKETAWSDLNDKLYFNPDFLENVSDRELDYVLMHLLLHVVLKHLNRKGSFEEKYYDEAADIVVNSNILRSNAGNLSSISLSNFGGIQEYMVPGGDEGWKYSVEEVYQMLRTVLTPSDAGDEGDEEDSEMDSNDGSDADDKSEGEEKSSSNSAGSYSGWDYHNRESEVQEADNNLQDEIWKERIMQAASAMQRRNSAKDVGRIPAFAERYLEELKKPQTDWRTVLDEFIQEEINDYSFCPPDRRFDDSPFFLPDFNEKDYRVEKVLFMIDTSGSMSDDEISQCYSEIKGAIDQFSGKLEGWLGFFDALVVEPQPFVDEDEFMAIRPEGGGGTRFDIIFKYVAEQMAEEPPVSIVILTDGYASFPKEREAHGIPVLWIIDNENVTPPWGKIARINVEK
jgi:predicted metal-dependent peptidase